MKVKSKLDKEDTMTILLELSVVFAICLTGEWLAMLLPIPMPASILSMGILFIAFLLRWLKVESVEQVSQFLLKNMAFFFIPAGVGILEYYELLKANMIPFILICILSTVLTFAATAYTVQLVIQLQTRKEQKDGADSK
ncbi:MAG: CidA/LrgA family protein [Cellulosilyticaceae bacterium]